MTSRRTTVGVPAGPPVEVSGRARDARAAVVGALVVAAIAAAGMALEYDGTGMNGDLHVNWPPLYADWLPHLGPGTPAAVGVAAGVVAYGPRLAGRLSWRALVVASWLAAMSWTWALALVDGWGRGVARRLATEHEYLRAVDRFADIGGALRGFTHHILLTQPQEWPAHVAGHPPAAVLTFVALDRVGLAGGGWAGAWCVAVGASAASAVLVAVRALGDERTARRAAPFVVLAPAAVWVGASADGYFAAVAAWGLALLVVAAAGTTRAPLVAALAAGVLLGLTVYLSYGLVLMAIPVAAVLLLARTARPLPAVLAGAAMVAVGFTLAGFSWWEGYGLLTERYYQGVAEDRPYVYWVWGNLANVIVTAGLASVAGLRRVVPRVAPAARRWRSRTGTGTDAAVILVLAMLLAIAVADVSGMSKAETERIWLPFTVWLPAAAALLPPADHRRWLLPQAALALGVNHLLLTGW